MSEVSDRIQAYKESGDGWTELRDWLVAHTFVEAKRYDDPQPGPTEERDWDNLHVDGSWDEVDRAHRFGQLTDDEYYEVARLRHDADTATGP